MILKELFALFGLDVDAQSFAKGQLAVEGVKLVLGGLKRGLQVAAEGFYDLIIGTSQTADMLDETAQAIGIGVAALQEIAYAASFSGMGMEELRQSLTLLTRNMQSAADGSDDQAAAFRKAGVAVRESDGHLRDAGDVLADLADHFKNLPDGADKTALALELFGRSGTRMIPFLNAGSAGIEELREQARELGIVMDETTIKQGAALDDTMTRLRATMTGLKNAIGGAFLADADRLAKEFLAWVRANRDLIKQRVERVINGIRVAARALLVVLRAALGVLGFIIDHWRVFAVLLGSVALAAILLNVGALGQLALGYAVAGLAAVKAAAAAATAWIVASLPLIALAGLVALLIIAVEDIYTALTGGESLIEQLGAKWVKFLEEFSRPQEGDHWLVAFLRLMAATILDLPQAWSDVISDLGQMWDHFMDWIVSGIQRMFDYFAAKWQSFKDFFTFGDAETPVAPAARFGGGASPAASVAASRGRLSAVQSEFNAQFSVYGAPGQEPGAVADEVVARMDAWHEARMEEALAAVSPGS